WLNAQTLLGRNNLALVLTDGSAYGGKLDPAKLLAAHGAKSDDAIVEFLLNVFLQGDVPAESRTKLLQYLKQAKAVKFPVYWTDDDKPPPRPRAVAHLVLTLPEFQLS